MKKRMLLTFVALLTVLSIPQIQSQQEWIVINGEPTEGLGGFTMLLSNDTNDSIIILGDSGMLPLSMSSQIVVQESQEHHDLLGLGDDDHPQYIIDTGDTGTGQHNFENVSISQNLSVDNRAYIHGVLDADSLHVIGQSTLDGWVVADTGIITSNIIGGVFCTIYTCTPIEFDSKIIFDDTVTAPAGAIIDSLILNDHEYDYETNNNNVVIFPFIQDSSVLNYDTAQVLSTSPTFWFNNQIRMTSPVSDGIGVWWGVLDQHLWYIDFNGAGHTDTIGGISVNTGSSRISGHTGTATINNIKQLDLKGAVGTGSTASFFESIKINDPSGTGTVTQQYGINIADLGSSSIVYGIRAYDRVVINKDNVALGLGAGTYGDARLFWDGNSLIINTSYTNYTAYARFSANVSAKGYLTETPTGLSIGQYDSLGTPESIIGVDGKLDRSELLNSEAVVLSQNDINDCWEEEYARDYYWEAEYGNKTITGITQDISEVPGIAKITEENPLYTKVCSQIPLEVMSVDYLSANNRILVSELKAEIESLKARVRALENPIGVGL